MMWALHRYRSDRALEGALRLDEVTGRTGDADVDELITGFNAAGVGVLATAVSGGGNELHLLVEEFRDPVVVGDVGSLHHADRMPMTPSPSAERRGRPPSLVEPNPAVVRRRPEPWMGLELPGRGDDQRTILVSFGHGAAEALHSAQVNETGDEITVTLYVGTLPQYASGGHLVPAVLYISRFRVDLERPLSGRCIRDGARTRT